LIAEIGPAELHAWRRDAGREAPVIVDVREPWEFAICCIDGSRALPLADLPGALDDLPRDRDLVIVCHHGVRSFHAAAWLAQAGFTRVMNLRGGLAAWAQEVDPAMPRY
jgi:rhodanese-related sulfurtransferase